MKKTKKSHGCFGNPYKNTAPASARDSRLASAMNGAMERFERLCLLLRVANADLDRRREFDFCVEFKDRRDASEFVEYLEERDTYRIDEPITSDNGRVSVWVHKELAGKDEVMRATLLVFGGAAAIWGGVGVSHEFTSYLDERGSMEAVEARLRSLFEFHEDADAA